MGMLNLQLLISVNSYVHCKDHVAAHFSNGIFLYIL